MTQVRGKILSISGDVAEVCIINTEDVKCGSCSACPKKMGIQNIIKVPAIKGIQIGQEVVLLDNKNLFTKNKILFVIVAFILGIIVAEGITSAVALDIYKKEVDILGGSTAAFIMLLMLWIKMPKYHFRVKLLKGEKP